MAEKLYPKGKLQLFLEKLSELQKQYDVIVVPYEINEELYLGLEADDGTDLELGFFRYDNNSKRFKLTEK